MENSRTTPVWGQVSCAFGFAGREKNCSRTYPEDQPQQESWQGQIAIPMQHSSGDVEQIQQQRALQQTPPSRLR